jgi:hypothetical protein
MHIMTKRKNILESYFFFFENFADRNNTFRLLALMFPKPDVDPGGKLNADTDQDTQQSNTDCQDVKLNPSKISLYLCVLVLAETEIL